MRLNTIKADKGSRKAARRVGRGIGSTLGKTCGKGHKGLKARSGGSVPLGFEGGQMPIQRRLPKVGFTARVSLVKESVRLSKLEKLEEDTIDLHVLKAAGLVKKNCKFVKIYMDSPIEKTIHLKGINVTKSVEALIKEKGGSVDA